MNKKEEKELPTLKPVVTGNPVSTNDVLQPKVNSSQYQEPQPGEVGLVRLGADGSELPNSYFCIGQSTYERVYKNDPRFLVKKKVVKH